MTMKAFHGDVGVKAELVERVRARWNNGELFSAGVLRWMPEQKAFSIGGALAQTADNDEFEKTTGIPIQLALLCESVVATTTVMFEDKEKATGYDFVTDKEIKRFEMEWLDAIHPGAQLSGVLPQFMAFYLETLLAADFAMAKHIEPGVRAVGERILEKWRAELAGQTSDPATWRSIRNDAVKASGTVTDPWCYPIAYFMETLAWPVADVAGEFGQPFGYLTGNWISFLRRPFYAEEHRNRGELSLVGFRKMEEAEKAGVTGDEAIQKFLDTIPEIKKAMMPLPPEDALRYKKDQVRAFEATTPPMRRMMDRILKLIAAAE
jgi:hypothetical protein